MNIYFSEKKNLSTFIFKTFVRKAMLIKG